MAQQGHTKPLTEAQRMLLAAAAQRNDRRLVLPPYLRGGAVAKVLGSLAARGLIERAEEGGEGADGGGTAEGEGSGTGVSHDATVGASGGWRVSLAGLAAIGVEDHPDCIAAAVTSSEATAPDPQGAPDLGDGDEAALPASDAGGLPPRPGTKAAAVLALLGRAGGASLDEIVAATGWLPHTARAALTGLRQRGIGITRQRGADGTSRYHATLAADPGERRDEADADAAPHAEERT